MWSQNKVWFYCNTYWPPSCCNKQCWGWGKIEWRFSLLPPCQQRGFCKIVLEFDYGTDHGWFGFVLGWQMQFVSGLFKNKFLFSSPSPPQARLRLIFLACSCDPFRLGLDTTLARGDPSGPSQKADTPHNRLQKRLGLVERQRILDPKSAIPKILKNLPFLKSNQWRFRR